LRLALRIRGIIAQHDFAGDGVVEFHRDDGVRSFGDTHGVR
jgi:hypothetical protein